MKNICYGVLLFLVIAGCASKSKVTGSKKPAEKTATEETTTKEVTAEKTEVKEVAVEKVVEEKTPAKKTVEEITVTELKTTMDVAQFFPVEAGDTPERIIEKAAHVVPTERQMAYHEREYIGFIHWGPNAFSRREWGSGKESASLFNPSGLDTDQWCRLMKDAGMTQVVMVAKHHDGYCMWQTRYTKHSVAGSPWKNGKGDVLKEISLSCQKYGLKLGVYLSPADLYQIENAEGLYGNLSKYTERTIPREVPGRPFKDKRKFKFKVDDYNEYFLNQLFETLTEYGPIHEVWFDGAHPKRKGGQVYTYAAWYELIRTLAPDAVIFGKGPDVRWCGNEAGRTRSSEWNVIPLSVHPDKCTWPDLMGQDLGSRAKLMNAKYLYYTPAETDTSIRHGWFYRDETQHVRSADEVFDIYERSIGGNSILLLNIPPNREGTLSPRDAAALIKSGEYLRNTYTHSLLEGATSPAAVLDKDRNTFWAPEGSAGEFEITLNKPIKLNRFVLQEDIARHSQRVEKHALDAWIDNAWKEIASATTIGYKRILRFAPVTTSRLRVRIIEARLTPTISSVAAHYFSSPPGPVVIARNSGGLVTITSASKSKGGEIRYTLGGEEPTENSKLYTGPFELKNGGRVKAMMLGDKNTNGPICERLLGLSAENWKLHSVSSVHSGTWAGEKAFDGNPNTFWHTSWAGGYKAHPHHIAIDMGSEYELTGFTYLPRQDRRVPDSMIEKWRVETSTDGENWQQAAEGEFGNLLNDPSERIVKFDDSMKARYFKLISLKGVQDKPYAGAAEIGLLTE